MAKRSTKREEPHEQPRSIGPVIGLRLLKQRIEEGKQLLELQNIEQGALQTWRTVTEECVIKAFGKKTDHYYRFVGAGPPGQMIMAGHEPPESWYERRRRQELTEKLQALASLSAVLDLEVTMEVTEADEPLTSVQIVPAREVFLVHGHDHQARSEVARFVEKLGVKVTILDERPTQGRTIAEQLEAHGDVGFAIILLTPDDRGGSISTPPEQYQPRTRQNVMLELGYFWGRIGRARVCALYVSGVEIPSDFQGVLFTVLDPHDGWKLKLFRELVAAGLNPSSDALH